MKKYHLLAVVAFLLAVLMCVPAMAEEAAQPVATAHRATDVTIDGDLSDWNTNDPIVLNDASQLVRDGHFWNGPDDLSANVYIAWDETYLYIGADVTEDSVFGAIETLPLDGEDNFEVYISTNPDDDPARTQYAANDFKLFLIMDGEYWDTAFDRSMVPRENRMRFISKGMDGGENVLEGYEVAATQTTTGFIYEARIPWTCFSNEQIAVYTPEVGDTVNFNFLITDISYPCPGTEYIPQIAWTGTKEAMDTNPSSWGRLTLAE